MPEDFAPETLRDFDGTQWGGVRLEDTTRDDFKRRYRTKGGKFVRGEATIVASPSRLPWDIQVLQDGNKGDSHVTGFYLTLRDGGMRPDRLELDPKDGEEWFASQRYSDWSVLAFPQKGILLMDLKDRDDRVPTIVLTTPRRLQRILDKLDKRPSRIGDVRDEFERLSRTVEIGTVSVSLSKKDIAPRDQDRFRDNIRERVIRDIDRGDIRYRRSGDGSVSISVSIKFKDDDKNNEVSVSASFDSANERGKISVSSSGSKSLDRDRSRAESDIDYATERATRDAIDDLLRQVDAAIRNQKPPLPEDMRTLNFLQIIDGPTK